MEDSFQKAATEERNLKNQIDDLRKSVKINNIGVVTAVLGFAGLMGTILVSLFLGNTLSVVIALILICVDVLYYLLVSSKCAKGKKQLFELELEIRDAKEEKQEAFSMLRNTHFGNISQSECLNNPFNNSNDSFKKNNL